MDESHVSASRLALAAEEAADAEADEARTKLDEDDDEDDESMRAAIALNADSATIDLRTRR